MLELLLIPAFSVLNRIRGGGFGAYNLPGHPRFYVTAVVGLLCWPLYGWLTAAYIAVSYLAWSILPWGSWYGLGRFDHPDESMFEKVVTRISFNDDHVAFTIRNFLGLLPAAVLIHPFMLMLAPIQTLLYELSWIKQPKTPITAAELLTGGMWGWIVVTLVG